MQAIDAFFAQNSDKTLVVDFGNASAIADGFTVPQNIRHLTIVGDEFLYGCSGLEELTLSQQQEEMLRSRIDAIKSTNDSFLIDEVKVLKWNLP